MAAWHVSCGEIELDYPHLAETANPGPTLFVEVSFIIRVLPQSELMK
jgi:hypothetical protein